MRNVLFAFVTGLLAFAALALATAFPVASVQPYTSYAQTSLATFVDKPSDTIETYPGSGMYKASISQGWRRL